MERETKAVFLVDIFPFEDAVGDLKWLLVVIVSNDGVTHNWFFHFLNDRWSFNLYLFFLFFFLFDFCGRSILRLDLFNFLLSWRIRLGPTCSLLITQNWRDLRGRFRLLLGLRFGIHFRLRATYPKRGSTSGSAASHGFLFGCGSFHSCIIKYSYKL